MKIKKHIKHLKCELEYYNGKLKSSNIDDIINETYYLERRFFVELQLDFIKDNIK